MIPLTSVAPPAFNPPPAPAPPSVALLRLLTTLSLKEPTLDPSSMAKQRVLSLSLILKTRSTTTLPLITIIERVPTVEMKMITSLGPSCRPFNKSFGMMKRLSPPAQF